TAPQRTGWWSRYREWIKEHRQAFRGVFSASIFGRQLTRDSLVAEFASLGPVLDRPFNLLYAEAALLGILALRAHRVVTAQSILEDVRFAISPIALTYVMRGVMRFVYIAGIVLYLLPGIVFALWENKVADLASTDGAKVGFAAAFGCIGGVVSVLLRLSEFEA